MAIFFLPICRIICLGLVSLVFLASGAFAQSTVTVIGPITPGDCAVFNSTTVIKDSGSTGCTGGGGGGTPGGSNGQVQYNNAGNFGGFTTNGDGSINTATGVLTVTKTNGVAFGPLATSSTVPNADLAPGTTGTAKGTVSGSVVDVLASTLLNSACSVTPSICTALLGYASPLWYGAVCNNSTDDYTALLTMFAAHPPTVLFPATKCAVKTLTAGGTNPHIFVLSQPTHLWFRDGGGISKSTVTGILFDIQTDGVTIDGSPNAIIDGGWATTLYTGFDVAVSTNDYDTASTQRNFIKVADVQFTNWAQGAIFPFYCNVCTFQNIYVNNVAYGGIFCSACTNFAIVNNHVVNVWSSTGPDIPPNTNARSNHYGIAVSTNLAISTPSFNGIVVGNVVNNVPGWECYDGHSPQNVIYANNVGVGCNTGIAISSPSPLVATDITVVGNKITCIPLGSATFNGGSGISVGGAGISAVGLSSGSPSARGTFDSNIVQGCGPDNTTLEGTIGAVYIANWIGYTANNNKIYSPIYRAFMIADFTRGNLMGNFIENLTAGPMGGTPNVIETQGANTTINLGENTADGASYNGYSIDQPAGAGFGIGISRSNILNGVSTLYTGGTQVNRTDLGASAP